MGGGYQQLRRYARRALLECFVAGTLDCAHCAVVEADDVDDGALFESVVVGQAQYVSELAIRTLIDHPHVRVALFDFGGDLVPERPPLRGGFRAIVDALAGGVAAVSSGSAVVGRRRLNVNSAMVLLTIERSSITGHNPARCGDVPSRITNPRIAS